MKRKEKGDLKEKNIAVVYHSADFDGIACREVARCYYPNATFIGWNHGDPVPIIRDDHRVILMDLSIDELMSRPNLVWIDHHKTAIEKYPLTIPGVRINGVAACRLAWQWFFSERSCGLLTADNFKNREVTEPLVIRLIGEHDVWDHRDTRSLILQHGLQSVDLSDTEWNCLLNPTKIPFSEREREILQGLLDKGAVVQRYVDNQTSLLSNNSFELFFEGYMFLCINTPLGNSLMFTKANPLRHDGLMKMFYNGDKWKVTLYGVEGTNHDLSIIAKKYGGGGHKQACGFECADLSLTGGELEVIT
jgi:hypothetical protein